MVFFRRYLLVYCWQRTLSLCLQRHMLNVNDELARLHPVRQKNIILRMVFFRKPIVHLNKSHRSSVKLVRELRRCGIQPVFCSKVFYFFSQDDTVAALPDGVDDYALMKNLVLINISNSKTLDRAPLGWAYVPNEQLTIDLHGAKYFSNLPFQLCTVNTNLTTLDVRGTVAETTMNWAGQLSAANLSSFDTNALNGACVVALKGLRSLSLANNNLTLW